MSIWDDPGAISGGDNTAGGFRHEAFFYAGDEEFVTGTSSFIRDGLAAGQSTLVAVLPDKIDRLRAELGREADQVSFVDMGELGRNPAQIIPEWRRFVDAARPGVKLRGIGEPIWSARGHAELVESQIHEILLNVAFPDSPPLWLLCPYDTDELEPGVLGEARRSHPFVLQDRRSQSSPDYRDATAAYDLLADALPPPPRHHDVLVFEPDQLGAVRTEVSAQAAHAGLSQARAEELVVAVNEITTNSVRHGGHGGVVRFWKEGDAMVCEVTDRGHVDDPLVGRSQPGVHQSGNRGLWLANHLCDLVQLRSSPRGTTVRLHMRSV